MKFNLVAIVLLAGTSWAQPWSANQLYQSGDIVTHQGERYECRQWPAEGWCGLSPYQPGEGAFWPMAWQKLTELENQTIHPEFVLGETQPQAGETYYYLGECWQPQHQPGMWETPKAGWFWQQQPCTLIEQPPALPMMAIAAAGKHLVWRDNNTLVSINYQFDEASIESQSLADSDYSGLVQFAGKFAGAYQVNPDTLGVFLSTNEYLEYSLASASVLPGFPVPASEYFAGMQEGVVGVMRWRNLDRIYTFYSDGTYDRITLSRKQVDSGYPKPVAGHWPGLESFGTQILAISTVLPDFADILLTDNRVIRYDLAADRVVAGYPQVLPAAFIDKPYNDPYQIVAGVNGSGWQTVAGHVGLTEWQSAPTNDYTTLRSAAFDLGNGKQAWFLRDGRYVEVETATGQVLPGFPKAQAQAITGMTGEQQVVAALKWNASRVHLFLADGSYLRVNLSQRSVDSGYPKTINDSTWPGLGQYAQRIQAVLNNGYDYADVLLNDQTVVRYSIRQDKVISGLVSLACMVDYAGLLADTDCQLDFISTPYLQAPSPTSMTVMFEMQAKGGVVEYWQDGGQVQQVTARVSPQDPLALVQEAKLTGLDSNTSYQYRVVVNNQASATYQFHTYPASVAQRSAAKFIAVSDVQSGNVNVLPDIVQGIIDTECGGVAKDCAQQLAGIIMAGDITETGGNRSHWREHLLARMAAITPYVPLVPVTGNHDYYGDAELNNYRSYFAPPSNGSDKFDEHWYALDYLDFRFLGLDSYPISGLNGRFNATTLATQQQWLTDTLAQSQDKSFVVAAFHHPCLSEMWLKGESIGLCEAVKTLETFSAQTGITTGHVFGHTHSYSRGQSRDVPHLWLNAASVAGNLEPLNDQSYVDREVFDYDTIAVSNNHYGYSTLEFDFIDKTMLSSRRDFDRKAGQFPQTDQVRFANSQPLAVPQPATALVQNIDALTLAVAETTGAYELHWQVSKQADFSGDVFDLWGNKTREENWHYPQDASQISGNRSEGHQPINLQAGADIGQLDLTALLATRGQALGGEDQFYWRKLYTGQATHSSNLNRFANQYRASLAIAPGDTLYWRVRARSPEMVWSDWSEISAVQVAGQLGNELLVDTQWVVTEGVMQRIKTPTSALFAPASEPMVWAGKGHGGASTSGNQDWMQQEIAARAGEQMLLTVAMTTWENRDQPEVIASARLSDGSLVELASLTTRYARVWDYRQQPLTLPADTVALVVTVGGTRYAGSDNDIYFDKLSVKRITP